MAYDTMYGDLSSRGTTNQILTDALEISQEIELLSEQVAIDSASAAASASQATANSSVAVIAKDQAAASAAQALGYQVSAANSAATATQAAADAVTNSSAALIIANDADDKADAALATANGIAGTADSAFTVAVAANNTAMTANTNSNTALTNANTALSTANGIAGTANTALTNSNSAVSTANTALSTANSKQPLDATLSNIAAQTIVADSIMFGIGADAFGVTTLTPYARNLIDDANAASARGTLGLGSASIANTLGTVSESGGIPTGAIIETSTNGNGRYTRFADGTQICTFTGGGLAATSVAGNSWISSTSVWTFPAPFLTGTSPCVVGSPAQGSATFFGNASDPTATVAQWVRVSMYSDATARSSRLFAIGRWF